VVSVTANHKNIIPLDVNASLRADFFRMPEVLNICINIQNDTDISVTYLRVTSRRFQFPLLSAFTAWMTEHELK